MLYFKMLKGSGQMLRLIESPRGNVKTQILPPYPGVFDSVALG